MYKEFIDFVRDIYQSNDFIPLHVPRFVGNEKEYLLHCIDSTFVSSVGDYVDRFEEEIARYTGASQAVVCVNGTNALQIALMLAGVERGDEVITQPLSFVATCNAISYLGANIVFVDVDDDTMGLSPFFLAEWLAKNAIMTALGCVNRTTGNRIRACVPVHSFGHPARMTELIDICNTYGLVVVEDAAESLGSLYYGRHTGLFGKIGVLSFNGNKIITTGGGGMLLFNDLELALRAKHLTTQAKMPHRWKFIHDQIGYNFRMPNINAALGCAQLEQIHQYIEDKRATAEMYNDFFKAFNGVCFFKEPANCRSNYWLNSIIFEDENSRDEFLEYTNSNGVMTRPAWGLMNKLPMFKSCESGTLDHAKCIADKLVNIPSGVRLC